MFVFHTRGPRCGGFVCPPRDGGLLRCGEFVDSPEYCFEGKCSQRAFPCRRVEAGEFTKMCNDAGLGPPGAAAHQHVVPGASRECLAAARSNRSHTPRRKALRCVSDS